MNPRRKKRMAVVLSIVIGGGATLGLTLYALNQNIDLFYIPSQILNGRPDGSKPVIGQRLRVGGVVVVGSVNRSHDSLKVNFKLKDIGDSINVTYNGILPDLFREGQGIVAYGVLRQNNTIEAYEVLAKHDENYMPPVLAEVMPSSNRIVKAQQN